MKPITTWQFAACPYTTSTQKAAKISNKNFSFNWAHSIYPEWTNASHYINLFTNSCDHTSTNGKAPLYPHNNQQHPQFLYPWLAPDVMAAMLVHWTTAKKFGNLTLFFCKMQATFFFCFVHKYGRLITWMEAKNSLWRRANVRINCQLSKSFAVVIRPLSTRLIKPCFKLCLNDNLGLYWKVSPFCFYEC